MRAVYYDIYLDEVIEDPGGWSDVFPDIFVYLIRFSEFYSNTAISWLSLNVKDVKTSSKGVWNYNLWATIVSAVLSAASYYWTNFCSNLCLDLHQGCQQLRKQGGKREDWIKSVFLPALLYVNVRYKSLMIKNVQQICLFLKAILLTMEMLHCLHCSALVQSDIILHASKVMWTKAWQMLYWLLWNYQFVSSRLMIGGSKVI